MTKLITGLAAAVCLSATSSFAISQSQKTITYIGSVSLSAADIAAPSDVGLEFRSGPEVDRQFNRLAPGAVSPARVPADHVPTPADSAVLGVSNIVGFNGLTHREQRLASGGNQFSLEPPDQGLAVGNGFIVESVNLAIRVRSITGASLTPAIGLNAFFGLAPAITRSTPPRYGPFVSDPRCYFDRDTQRWFVTVLAITTNPATGALLGHSAVLLAVSQTPSPVGAWRLYSIDTTNNTGTADHPGCPCFGDQPLIGADAYGFYISTNEFSIAGPNFNGAQIYAMSKLALAAGSVPALVVFSGIPLAESISYTLQPAITAQGGQHASANGGTEYFLSALDFNATLDNRIAIWALTNTVSLATPAPALHLTSAVLDSQAYGQPPDAQQQPGPLPLADLIQSGAFGKASAQHLPLLAGNDDRMQQVTWAAGRLWSSLNTVVKPENGPVRVGAAYFVVTPTWTGGRLGGVISNQGYVSLSQNSVLYPSVGVNAAGRGVIAFSIAGDAFNPSAAYAPIDSSGAGAIHIAAAGAAPADGFSGYAFFGGRTERWGDYSAAVADISGAIWFASEYIPNAPRTALANWGTFIASVQP